MDKTIRGLFRQISEELSMVLTKIINRIQMYQKKKLWRKLHPDSDTLPANEFFFDHVTVGKNTYGLLRVIDQDKNGSRLKIGSFCSIAENVTFLLNEIGRAHV